MQRDRQSFPLNLRYAVGCAENNKKRNAAQRPISAIAMRTSSKLQDHRHKNNCACLQYTPTLDHEMKSILREHNVARAVRGPVIYRQMCLFQTHHEFTSLKWVDRKQNTCSNLGSPIKQ
eukprot:TRINITY_DN34291_c0_g1_i1.p1 TRINITY_DN34291_c0_g1~~TRINITY_DN34291_c0_g1_i1.p1  ORF type:complete len:119 (-),score=0.99 TRINITY_DN34291_c0_g1_i1:284-640(-)